MKLYLTTDNPFNTSLATSDGSVQYNVRTPRAPSAFRTSKTWISTPTTLGNEGVLGELVWGGIGRQDMIRSVLFGEDTSGKIKIKDFLFTNKMFGGRYVAWYYADD